MNTTFKNKLFLGIDYGTKVIGLATYNWGNDPYPLAFGKIIVQNQERTFQELLEIIQQEAIEAIVLGLPYYTDGNESNMTKTVQEFGLALQSKLKNVDFYTQDETLTSFEAEERMKNSPRYNFKVQPKELDALSASIILEDFVKLHSA